MKELTPETEAQFSAVPAETLEEFKLHMTALEANLIGQDPMMKEHLRNSHRILLTYPESAHLLDDDEIHLLIKRQEEYSNTQILTEAAKGKGSRGKGKIDVANDL